MSSVAYSGGLYQGIFLSGHSVDPSVLLNAPADKITAGINNSGSDTSWVKQLHQSGQDILLLVNNTTGETSFPSGSTGNFPSGYTTFVVHSLDQFAPTVASALTTDNVNVMTTSELPPATADANLTKWLAKQIGAAEYYHVGHPSDVTNTYGSWDNELGRQYNQTQIGYFSCARWYYSPIRLYDGLYYRIALEVDSTGDMIYISTETATQTSNPFGSGYFTYAGSTAFDTRFRLGVLTKEGPQFNKAHVLFVTESGFSGVLNYRQNPEWDVNSISINYTGAATGTPGDSTYTIESSGGINIDITDIMSNADFYTNTSGDNIKASINNTDALIIAADGTIYHPATGTTELVIPDGVSVLTGTLLIDPNSSSYETWIPIIIPDDDGGPVNSIPPIYSSMVDSGNLPSELTHESLIGNWNPFDAYQQHQLFYKS